MLHKDCRIRWILVRGTAIRSAAGNPIRVIGTDTDVTQRKPAENELIEASDDLEIRVNERTAELAKKKANLRSYLLALQQ